jgi:O-antigen/teichoic acid export membrane protein
LRGYLALATAALQGANKVVQSQLVEQLLVPIAALLIYAVLTLNQHLDLTSALAGQTASVLLGVAILLYGLSSYLKSQPRVRPDYAFGEWLPSLRRFAVLAVLSVVSSQQPVLLTSLLASDEEVGYLKIAVSVGLVISLPLLVTNQAITPRLTIAANNNDRLQMKHLAKKAARLSLLIALPAGVMMMIFSREVIGTVFGASYLEGGSSVLSIIVIGQIINVACGPVGLILNMSGKEKSTLVWMFVSLCLTALLSIILIPGYGALGAALAATIGLILWNLLLLSEVKRQFGFSAAAL